MTVSLIIGYSRAKISLAWDLVKIWLGLLTGQSKTSQLINNWLTGPNSAVAPQQRATFQERKVYVWKQCLWNVIHEVVLYAICFQIFILTV